ncbi:MAG: hypothetical protein QOK35_390, partial [Pseudonocardiales bacterium]|nr:hypothetical protein [Pseudonocardiales bacterium]
MQALVGAAGAVGAAGHGDVARPVGAPDRHARVLQAVEQHDVRVVVHVARTDADQHRPRRHGGEERGQAVAAAVMRHLQHVGAQRDARREQLRLRGDLDVPAEQHRPRGRDRTEHDRTVVDLRAVVRVDVLRRALRPDHVQGERGPRQPGADRDLHDRRAGDRRQPAHPRQRRPGLVDRADGDRPHRPSPQRSGETADVVGVQVADHHERQGRDAEPTQAGVDGAVVGSGVVQHRASLLTRGQDQRVTLPDVSGDHRPTGRRPARPHDPRRHED